MAEERAETSELKWREWFPWTELFRGFRVALGPSKLLLAALGILVMSLGWYVLALLFYNASPEPQWPSGYDSTAYGSQEAAWAQFQKDWARWNLMYRAAGDGGKTVEPADLASSPEEWAQLDEIKKAKGQGLTLAQLAELVLTRPEDGKEEKKKYSPELVKKAQALFNPEVKEAGRLRTLPWFEDRGENPYLIVTGQAGKITAEGTVRRLPWEEGHFWEWLLGKQVPVLVEPLAKILLPVIYFFKPEAGLGTRFYFLLVLLWTIATWAFFGGAITRIAAVEVARNESISIFEAIRFVWKRYFHYLSAPLLPLLLVALILVFLLVFGLVSLIPYFGTVLVDGLLWWLPLGLGVVMAGLLVGLVSWPLMSATISAEDEEALNAFSRAYSYVIQAPWNYVWNSAVALMYGAVVVFFVGFMGSLTVYLAKWGVCLPAQTLGVTSYDPVHLFVYAPTSFQWRELLLEGTPVVQEGRVHPETHKAYVAQLGYDQWAAAVLVSLWLGLFFLLVLGFGYSYFWSTSTIIYLLMRKKVDDAELDEVYLEEEDQDGYSPGVSPPPKPAAAAAPPGGVTMVESPTFRPPASPTPVAPPASLPPAPEKPPETGPAASPSPPASDSAANDKTG